MGWTIRNIKLIKQDKWYGQNFPLQYLGHILVTLSLITPTETKYMTVKKNQSIIWNQYSIFKINIWSKVQLSLR